MWSTFNRYPVPFQHPDGSITTHHPYLEWRNPFTPSIRYIEFKRQDRPPALVRPVQTETFDRTIVHYSRPLLRKSEDNQASTLSSQRKRIQGNTYSSIPDRQNTDDAMNLFHPAWEDYEQGRYSGQLKNVEQRFLQNNNGHDDRAAFAYQQSPPATETVLSSILYYLWFVLGGFILVRTWQWIVNKVCTRFEETYQARLSLMDGNVQAQRQYRRGHCIGELIRETIVVILFLPIAIPCLIVLMIWPLVEFFGGPFIRLVRYLYTETGWTLWSWWALWRGSVYNHRLWLWLNYLTSWRFILRLAGMYFVITVGVRLLGITRDPTKGGLVLDGHPALRPYEGSSSHYNTPDKRIYSAESTLTGPPRTWGACTETAPSKWNCQQYSVTDGPGYSSEEPYPPSHADHLPASAADVDNDDATDFEPLDPQHRSIHPEDNVPLTPEEMRRMVRGAEVRFGGYTENDIPASSAEDEEQSTYAHDEHTSTPYDSRFKDETTLPELWSSTTQPGKPDQASPSRYINTATSLWPHDARYRSFTEYLAALGPVSYPWSRKASTAAPATSVSSSGETPLPSSTTPAASAARAQGNKYIKQIKESWSMLSQDLSSMKAEHQKTMAERLNQRAAQKSASTPSSAIYTPDVEAESDSGVQPESEWTTRTTTQQRAEARYDEPAEHPVSPSPPPFASSISSSFSAPSKGLLVHLWNRIWPAAPPPFVPRPAPPAAPRAQDLDTPSPPPPVAITPAAIVPGSHKPTPQASELDGWGFLTRWKPQQNEEGVIGDDSEHLGTRDGAFGSTAAPAGLGAASSSSSSRTYTTTETVTVKQACQPVSDAMDAAGKETGTSEEKYQGDEEELYTDPLPHSHGKPLGPQIPSTKETFLSFEGEAEDAQGRKHALSADLTVELLKPASKTGTAGKRASTKAMTDADRVEYCAKCKQPHCCEWMEEAERSS